MTHLILLTLGILIRPARADPCEVLRTVWARALVEGRTVETPGVQEALQACDAGWDDEEPHEEPLPTPATAGKAEMAAWIASQSEDRCDRIRANYAELRALGGDVGRYADLLQGCPAAPPSRDPGRGTGVAPVMARWTFQAAHMTSGFGWRMHPVLQRRLFHKGMDFDAEAGEPVPALGAGRVVFAGDWKGYGLAVVVEHAPRTYTLYAHNQRLLVGVGDRVVAGQVVAEAGSTGMSTGSHVHLEVRVGGVSRDPAPYVKDPSRLGATPSYTSGVRNPSTRFPSP